MEIIKDYPELSEWFETGGSRDRWQSVEVEVPTPKQQVQVILPEAVQASISNSHLRNSITVKSSVTYENLSTSSTNSTNIMDTINCQSVIQKTASANRTFLNRPDANMNTAGLVVSGPDSPSVASTVVVANNQADGPGSQQLGVGYTSSNFEGQNLQKVSADIEQVLDASAAEDTQESLNACKSSFGCTWHPTMGGCDENCAFVESVLKLQEYNHNVAYQTFPRTQKVTIVRQTPEGFVKVTETQAMYHSQNPVQFTKLPAKQYMKKSCDEISGGPVVQLQPVYLANSSLQGLHDSLAVKLESRPLVTGIYLPAPMHVSPPMSAVSLQSNVHISSVHPEGEVETVKLSPKLTSVPAIHPYTLSSNIPSPGGGSSPSLPTPSPSPPAAEDLVPDFTLPLTEGSLVICATCNHRFNDHKQLVKHKRNHHQTYVCKECGVCLEGYYQMASHSKREHQKEPIYFCECGRNFGEKKGMTKHQNTCKVFKGGI